jgi:DNA polymerase
MAVEYNARDLVASLREYLEELQETGVEDLPLDDGVTPAVRTSIGSNVAGNDMPDTLTTIRDDLGDCHRCALGSKRTNLVFGVGNPQARLVFVGEAPGRDEDLQGEPFVGEAGQLLTRLITRMGLTRDDVYICNVLKCRPDNNRDPLPDEVEACHAILLRQLKAIKPEVIVCLGKFAVQTLLAKEVAITKLRGNFQDYHGIPLMPTFHPSYLLHNKNNTDLFWLVWDDMVQVLQKLGMAVPEVQRKGR